jgi:hypothetical protein
VALGVGVGVRAVRVGVAVAAAVAAAVLVMVGLGTAAARYQIGDAQARSWIVTSRPPVDGSLEAQPGAMVCQLSGLLCFRRRQS